MTFLQLEDISAFHKTISPHLNDAFDNSCCHIEIKGL